MVVMALVDDRPAAGGFRVVWIWSEFSVNGSPLRLRNHLSRRPIITSGFVLLAVASVMVAFVFWDWLGSNSATLRNVVLVAAAVAALPLALWRSRIAERQVNTAQRGLLNERCQKGAEMLGSAVLSVRLGGIYALQSLAEEHPGQYHVRVMRLFCAFVRSPPGDRLLAAKQVGAGPEIRQGMWQDTEAITEIIQCRSAAVVAIEREAGFVLDLRGANPTMAWFMGADLAGAYFHWAKLSNANFEDANLSGAHFDFADLSGATFFRANLTRVGLLSADLSGASLQDARLSWALGHRADLSQTNLERADLSDGFFQEAKLKRAVLHRANLSGTSFLGAALSGAKLTEADLSGAHFLDACLDGADLSGANLSGTQFSNSGFQPATGLRQAQLDRAWSDADNPPELAGVDDADGGYPLVWIGGTRSG